MDSMYAIAANAIDQMPPANRFSPADAEVIARHRGLLHSLRPRIVQSFYDTLFEHPRTAAVFHDGERPAREQTLTQWWQRTVDGPIDEDYFAWMAMVGLVHVVRDVTNPMMLSMADQVARLVGATLDDSALPRSEQRLLGDAVRRLAATVSAIITFGYDHAVVSALYDVAGMPEALLRRLRNHEVADALSAARTDLGR